MTKMGVTGLQGWRGRGGHESDPLKLLAPSSSARLVPGPLNWTGLAIVLAGLSLGSWASSSSGLCGCRPPTWVWP